LRMGTFRFSTAGGVCFTGLEPAWMLMAQSDLSVYHLLYGKFA
jgi:hypothetical protein